MNKGVAGWVQIIKFVNFIMSFVSQLWPCLAVTGWGVVDWFSGGVRLQGVMQQLSNVVSGP